MSTHNEHESHDKKASMQEGYEVTDVSVQGIVVFIVGLFVSVGVFFVLCFGLGKVINYGLAKYDGPPNKWNATNVPQPGKLQNMESNPAEQQQKLQQLTQRFPTPRLETDDGNQDLANLHGREDLLLDHYTWVDGSHTKVRVPIGRAMELVAQHGLPVANQLAPTEQLMAGETRPVVQMPLTDGFARTGFEQQEMGPTRLPGEQASTKANNR
jgi:hypothetical protein